LPLGRRTTAAAKWQAWPRDISQQFRKMGKMGPHCRTQCKHICILQGRASKRYRLRPTLRSDESKSERRRRQFNDPREVSGARMTKLARRPRGRPKGLYGPNRAKCVRLFVEGIAPVDIAPRLGITLQAVTLHLRQAGYDPYTRKLERLAEHRRRFQAVWQSSECLADAAKSLGLTRAQALTRAESFRRLGIKLRLLGIEDRTARKLAGRKRFLGIWNAAPTVAEAARLLGYSVGATRTMAKRFRRDGLPLKYRRKPPSG
jgi:hypothetical protein